MRGKSGDGGIDGVGVLRVNLVSFQIYFQCKRWRGSVPAKEIGDFRGALQGRPDKGLFITTGTFTTQASDEASREGAIAIDLIDGDRFCDLLKENGLGVETVESVRLTKVGSKVFERNGRARAMFTLVTEQRDAMCDLLVTASSRPGHGTARGCARTAAGQARLLRRAAAHVDRQRLVANLQDAKVVPYGIVERVGARVPVVELLAYMMHDDVVLARTDSV